MIRQRLTVLSLLLFLAPAAGCGPVDKALGRLTLTLSSESMEPTIKKGARVSARRTDDDYVPRRGDIVVYRAPDDWSQLTPGNTYISRAIGVPGDRVACCDDPKARLQVNGAPLDEPFVTRGPASDRWFDVKVPQDRIWIMSDNRRVSLDSRYQMDKAGGGTIGRKDVIAVVEDWEQP
ncbi:signal peptidase I [Nonomuraea aurantiaca]|uniref:signal peptidase I n=1 Tax=Nonomuraea aurantiaca TaxID=2878562 RepID=UPI001CD9B0D8|nr:signal peptidase I [Nonomuraea aurantiaca]MCA2228198.1 signal peptidase I [Nonomuraea aurantiaca]